MRARTVRDGGAVDEEREVAGLQEVAATELCRVTGANYDNGEYENALDAAAA